jgi:DNA-binding response OmpR family regulator
MYFGKQGVIVMDTEEMVKDEEEDVKFNGYKILLVDDDGVLLESLQQQLLESGYQVDIALSATNALRIAKLNRYDAYVLDVSFSDGDGRDICRELRARGEGAPVLLMTALDSAEDEVMGLEAGSNDYIHKPIRFDVFEARLRAHLQHRASSNEEMIKLQGFFFKPFEKRLVYGGTQSSVKLTEKETMILNHLIKARGKTVSREEFLREVWRYQPDTNTHTLETHVYRLRRKISNTGGDPDTFLRTDMGGYRIVF